MGYTSGNAAFAYDMHAPVPRYEGNLAPELEVAPRPRLDVVTGAGREADQIVSPAFMRVIKAFCVLAVLFCAVGAARVTIASFTAASLNANAELNTKIESAASESTDLEVKRSVFGASTRIREFATSVLGMVDSTDSSVTVDVSTPAVSVSEAN
ncbi:hypothetical protein [Collinsella vaginalis]|uniref:hypothetical protein n=1 Tax=Collinsella vaginalis TaxID=1870987 RepID=UPI000A26A4E8|nr:hypothetical protein [Collinsella vaginalis]